MPSKLALCSALLALVAWSAVSGQAASSPAPVTALTYRPDGKILFAGRTKEVLVFDVASGDQLGKLSGQGSKVTALACHPAGQLLAIASGESGQVGALRIYTLPPNGSPASAYESLQPLHAVDAHTDLIHDLAFSADGKLLATCSYDREVRIWELHTDGGQHELRRRHVLKDHSDAVYGVAFSPNGKLLASAAADRAVKVWDVASGKRLYTLGEATDWLHAIAWSPDGAYLAAGGVDRSIRVWAVNEQEGKIAHSIFAHTGPVSRLAYAADGKTLYSLGQDRTIKVWDTAKMVEKKVYPQQAETVMAWAVRRDALQLAVGRYDGVLQLLDLNSSKVQSELLPIKPKPPQITKLTPNAGQRGVPIKVSMEAKYLEPTAEIVVSHPNVKVQGFSGANPATFELVFPKDTPAGVYQVQAKTAAGTSNAMPFVVDLFPTIEAKGDVKAMAWPGTLSGSITRAGQVDTYRLHANQNDEIGIQVVLTPGAKLEPTLTVADSHGRVVVESLEGLLGFRCPQTGDYMLALRDQEYRAEAVGGYRMNVGPIPIVTRIFPLGIQRGAAGDVNVEGVHLGAKAVHLQAPADAAIGSRLPIVVETAQGRALGNKSVVIGAFPERTAEAVDSPGAVLPAPITVNGQLGVAKDADTFRFHAKKGERLVIEVHARRLGSPLDPFVEILDSQGKLLPRAVLRSTAKTYLTFRDHDAVTPNLRVEAWSELNINDYVMLGNELLRIRAIPTHPDADMVFFSVAGQRTGYLGTTPAHEPMGAPMYKVEIHPPGITFPPSGYPNFTIYYRNDDGGPGYGKDPRLFFDPPVEGDYQVRVGNATGTSSMIAGYRLTVRSPQPDFAVRLSPANPTIAKGGAVSVDVTAERMDGFEDGIAVALEGLPAGLSAPATTIPAGETTTSFALFADAAAMESTTPLKLVARATIAGHQVVRETTGDRVKLVEPGDIVTQTEQRDVSVRPGGEVRLTTRIERRNGFNGRVPLEVKGLPHGVKVRDIGLNGILITEKESVRTFVIYAEPWVEPQEHPIVVLARREGKNTEHAAASVLLKIVKD